MTEKKLSRRDALKILGTAVGATALATLPSKWSKPELLSGVLPAHARQSVEAPVVTCTKYSLYLEFLAVSGYFMSGVITSPKPDDGNFSVPPNAVGDWALWDCSRTGCFYCRYILNPISASNPAITVRFATNSDSVDVTWDIDHRVHWISVNFDTGVIAVDGCAPGCNCP